MIPLTAEKTEKGGILVDPDGNVWAYCPKWRYAMMLETGHKARAMFAEINRLLSWIKERVDDDARQTVEVVRVKMNRLDRGEE